MKYKATGIAINAISKKRRIREIQPVIPTKVEILR